MKPERRAFDAVRLWTAAGWLPVGPGPAHAGLDELRRIVAAAIGDAVREARTPKLPAPKSTPGRKATGKLATVHGFIGGRLVKRKK